MNFSTDQTALSVSRFIAARPVLTGRPQASDQHRQPAWTPVPLEVLYPSLYAERCSLVQRFDQSVHAIAASVGGLFRARGPLY
jgi:hypothetical protein